MSSNTHYPARSSGADLRSKALSLLGGIAVVVFAFSATLYALNWFSGSLDGTTYISNSTSESRPLVTEPSAITDLPKLAASGLDWSGMVGLNVRVMTGTPMVEGEPILQLTAIPTEGAHTLGIQSTALDKNRVYRITAWVKSHDGANFEIEAGDHASTGQIYGAAIFDVARNKVISAVAAAQPGAERGPEGWQKVWIDLKTSTGQFVVNFYVMNGGAIRFAGDGRLGATLGGFSVKPQG
jgi:hypothetical protein